jgi:hypothetical protein
VGGAAYSSAAATAAAAAAAAAATPPLPHPAAAVADFENSNNPGLRPDGRRVKDLLNALETNMGLSSTNVLMMERVVNLEVAVFGKPAEGPLKQRLQNLAAECGL